MTTDFALRLIEAREHSGFSQRDVAHLLGVAQSVLSQVESGQRNPSIELAAGFATVYGCDLAQLLDDQVAEVKADIATRLLELPATGPPNRVSSNRSISLRRLRDRLEMLTSDADDAD